MLNYILSASIITLIIALVNDVQTTVLHINTIFLTKSNRVLEKKRKRVE